MFHINAFVETLFNLQFFRSARAQKRYLERPTIDIKQITGHLENIAFSKNCVALQIRFLHNRVRLICRFVRVQSLHFCS
jgi:hypothetical protein